MINRVAVFGLFILFQSELINRLMFIQYGMGLIA